MLLAPFFSHSSSCGGSFENGSHPLEVDIAVVEREGVGIVDAVQHLLQRGHVFRFVRHQQDEPTASSGSSSSSSSQDATVPGRAPKLAWRPLAAVRQPVPAGDLR